MRLSRTSTTVTLVALLGATTLLAARPAEAGRSDATLEMGAHVAPRIVVSADRAHLTLAPGESATVVVTVKARVARGAAMPVVLEAPRDVAPLSYTCQGRAGRLTGPTTLGRVTGSGIHRLTLTVALDRAADGPVRLPLAVRAGAETLLVTAATSTRVSP